MATLLLISAQGRQRVALELAAQDAGHKTYSAGSLAEARRLLDVYVPEIVLVITDLPDGTGDAVVRAIRESDRAMVREVPIVTPLQVTAPGVVKARSHQPADLLHAVTEALDTGTPTGRQEPAETGA